MKNGLHAHTMRYKAATRDMFESHPGELFLISA